MLGDSAGRSRRHHVAPEAPRRATPRERQQIDPPWDRRVSRFEKLPLTQDRRMIEMVVVSWAAGLATGLSVGWLVFR